MYPSTEASDAERGFAANIVENLLYLIAENNHGGRYKFLVSHAWTEGPLMYLVFQAPPSDITFGLARDTRSSLIDPGPWPSLDEAVRYYYILDLEGIQPTAPGRGYGNEPGDILWLGDRTADCTKRLVDIPEAHRYFPPQRQRKECKRAITASARGASPGDM